jgi:hypothetical protein
MLPSKRAVLYAIRVERNTKQNQGCKNIYVVNTVRLEEIRMSIALITKRAGMWF